MRHVLALSLAASAVLPGSADACTCGVPVYRFPADGALDVPRDVEVAIAHGDLGEPALLADDGSEIPVRRRSGRGFFGEEWTLLSPLVPLASHCTYRIVIAGEASEFRTGSGFAPAPEPSDVEELWLSERTLDAECLYTCNTTPELRFAAMRWTAGSAVAYHELVLETPEERWSGLIEPGFPGTLSTTVCGGGLPALRAGQTLCGSLHSVGENGARSPVGASACSQVVSCPDGCGDRPPSCMIPFEPGPSPTVQAPGGCSIASPSGHPALLLMLVALVSRRSGQKVPSQSK